tara:strand:- start:828 stop:1403 length:576 start_codon:yes stop_codon:yes gene_type:complete
MKKIYILFLFSILIPISTFNIDSNKSTIKWKGSKSTGSFHDGYISIQKGFINIENNKILNGDINIDMNSITCEDIKDSTSNKYLIEHLKNDDFFSVTEFPISYLRIKEINHIENNQYLIKATLKIKDQTHLIDFIANIQIANNAAMATGKIEIDRTKFGIKYKSKTWYPDIGDRFINDIFELYFNLVAFPN